MSRVIPVFPHEIALMILRELPLADLINWYTINKDLKAALDDDEEVWKKMFRNSKNHDFSETTRVAWVRSPCSDIVKRLSKVKLVMIHYVTRGG